LLEIRDLSVSYGGALALDRVSVRVDGGQVVSVIGPNGAGKTTLLRAISGLVTYDGEITYGGRTLRALKPNQIVRAGIIHCPEAGQLFGEMTVEENLKLGAFVERIANRIQESFDRVYALFPVLADRRGQQAQTLSGGERQMLAIGRSLMGRPSLLMLDEPSLGLAPIVRDRIEESIRHVHQEWGLTVVLVEQDTAFALDIAERVYVLDSGRVVKDGPAAEIARDTTIRETYLGVT
jgi:branched-chain amino acid transport system ATP-binding protein